MLKLIVWWFLNKKSHFNGQLNILLHRKVEICAYSLWWCDEFASLISVWSTTYRRHLLVIG
jgi:hypothetical protein